MFGHGACDIAGRSQSKIISYLHCEAGLLVETMSSDSRCTSCMGLACHGGMEGLWRGQEGQPQHLGGAFPGQWCRHSSRYAQAGKRGTATERLLNSLVLESRVVLIGLVVVPIGVLSIN